MGYVKMEKWRKIPGYSRYEISAEGMIRNSDGKVMTQRLNGSRLNNKYLSVNIMGDGNRPWQERRKIQLVHHLILMAFVGLPQKGQIACHKNDIKTDNRLENLYWGTYSDNARDAIKHGLFAFTHPGFAENHASAKFSNETISSLLAEYTGKRGEQTKLAKKYGLSISHANQVINGKLRKTG